MAALLVKGDGDTVDAVVAFLGGILSQHRRHIPLSVIQDVATQITRSMFLSKRIVAQIRIALVLDKLGNSTTRGVLLEAAYNVLEKYAKGRRASSPRFVRFLMSLLPEDLIKV